MKKKVTWVYEINLDSEEEATRMRAIRRFMGREVLIEDKEEGWLRGKFFNQKGVKTYEFLEGKDKWVIDYRNLKQFFVVNPKRADYDESWRATTITDNTVRVSKLMGQRPSALY